MEKNNIVLTVGYQNLKGFLVSVETVTRRGIFQFDIIGLANKTIFESKQRILSAIAHSESEKSSYLNKKITTLLSPADSKKEGSHFDLPIAISYLVSKSKGNDGLFSETVILGELTLTGSILPVKNILTLIEVGIYEGIKKYIIPRGNMAEIEHLENIFVWEVAHIVEIIEALKINIESKDDHLIHDHFINNKNKENLEGTKENLQTANTVDQDNDIYTIDSISGNILGKRALNIALAGKHHILFIGVPGSGKSLLAKSSKELLPFRNNDMNIFQRQNKNKTSTSYFREPHHTTSYSDIIGSRFSTGELSLAHNGILFLDELSEFNRRVLESLRQPLENKFIQLHGEVVPTDFMLIACMNPCDCGYYKSRNRSCICSKSQTDKYLRKINSPLFQRFDMWVYFKTNNNEEDSRKITSNITITGKSIRTSILNIANIQEKRRQAVINKIRPKSKIDKDKSNSTQFVKNTKEDMLLFDLDNIKNLGRESKLLFEQICISHSLSKRESMSILRVARTIADLDKSDDITQKHILEALSYRRK